MTEDQKIQINVTYADGAIQSWGYDGQHFPTVAAALQNVAADFPDTFLDTYKNVKSILLIWGKGLPTPEALKNMPNKELEPKCGPALLEDVANWLEEIGVQVDGN